MEPPPKPWSPPANLWMYWGDSPNKRFGHSGDNMRHLVKLGRCGPIPATPPHAGPTPRRARPVACAAGGRSASRGGTDALPLFFLCSLAGGEFRDPHFLFDYSAQTFRDLSEQCCTAMLVPPMKNSMPIYNAQASVAQRLSTPPPRAPSAPPCPCIPASHLLWFHRKETV